MIALLYPWVKALHLLAVIALYCGLMYLPRLFVNHFQAEKGGEADTMLSGMERRLFKGICNPSLVAVWVLGLVLIGMMPAYAAQPWFIIKFVAVIAVSGIHGFYGKAVKQFSAGERPRTEKFWRIMNEVPFLLLILIVVMVIVKPFL